jgi:hypothetical protein
MESLEELERGSDMSNSSPSIKSPRNSIEEGNMAPVLKRIRCNCLKNNCDSVGLMNLEFQKLFEDDQALISQTDLSKFNSKEQLDNG